MKSSWWPTGSLVVGLTRSLQVNVGLLSVCALSKKLLLSVKTNCIGIDESVSFP